MATIRDKIDKVKHESIRIFKYKDDIFRLRAPTIRELTLFMTMTNNGDAESANYFLLSSCMIDKQDVDTIPDQLLPKMIDFFNEQGLKLSTDNYARYKKKQPNIFLIIAYRVVMFSGLTINQVLDMHPNEMMEHIIAIENITGEPLWDLSRKQYGRHTNPEQERERYNKTVGNIAKVNEMLRKEAQKNIKVKEQTLR